MLQTLSTAVLPLLVIAAAASDVTSYRIPNWLTGLTALLFFPMAFLTGMPWVVMGYHLAVGLGLFVIGFLMFSVGVFGGGDAKMMAAAGLWLGTSQTLPFISLTVLAGGLLGLAVLAWSALSMWSEIKGLKLSAKLQKLKPDVPYGFAMAVGVIMALPDSWWMNPASLLGASAGS
jgi:prepilin peptidase CpaA